MSSFEDQLSRLRTDLRTDRVLSLGQVQRDYQCEAWQLRHAGLYTLERFIGLTRHSKAQLCLFITQDQEVLEFRSHALRHLAGVAEMRRRLGADPNMWRSSADASFALLRPDAVWRTPEGRIAIEFDAGSYDPEQLRKKVEAFSGYAGQVWGAASLARARHLTPFLARATNDALALHVSWR